ncbi:PREDICTED: subtilisin-like protease SBT1.9 [Lupinus angustifolius]|nr:PREDICTED: subtilisin-like protease SBT1.9 [Lupinus angustifolius]
MATNICLCLRLSITFLHLTFVTLAQLDNYIIHMDLSAMPKPFSNQHNWYLATLFSALNNSEFTTNNLNSYSSKHIYTYTNVMNGFSASLTPLELEALKNSPGYISSIRDLPVKPDTTHSPQFLGLNPFSGAWPASEYGKDVIVGMLDTGVWPESRSFEDNGLTKIPSRWKGQCENSIQFNSSLCNNKLIGAKFFNKGLLAKNPNITIAKYNSTRDTEGHGTHTSSTAAGSKVNDVSYFGYASGTASGIASSARVAIYKTLWEIGGYPSDIIAAIDSAIEDGVDVLSLSFGLDQIPLYKDPVAIATFAAMERGIFVSTSAGNEGPYLKTLHNGTPWVITAAASTLDREYHGTLSLGNSVQITGLSLYPLDFSPGHVPIVFMGQCNNLRQLVKVRNKIVVCEDKNETLPDQVANVETAQVVGAVFISNSSDLYAFYLQNSFPSIIISPINGEIVKGYIKSNKLDAKASMYFKITTVGTRPAPSVDSYSSRGPSYSCPYVLKPDITAPGTSILAAWPKKIPATTLGSRDLFSNFNLLSGTSMSCPHVTGVAALLKGAYPHWSPAAIRSAIMTTSDILDNTLEPIKDIGQGYEPASPLAMGAGHINPNKALHPGLVYNVGVQDYVNLLCALNFTQKKITTITRSSYNNCSNPSLDLNYPSFIAFFDAKYSHSQSKTKIQEFERTVTNVGEGPTTYVASVTHIEGFHVSVIPNKLVFWEKNQKLRYKLRIEGRRMKNKDKKVAFGYLTWKDVKHVVRSPIVVTTLNL